MRVLNLRLAAVALISGISLAGCGYNGLYGGLGTGYGNYGYGSYGYGSPYGGYGYGSPYGGYGYGYGSPYGYGYGNPYGGFGNYIGYGYGGYPYGWYNGYYYPGSGYYVYDRNHRRRQITDAERQYWRDKFGRMTGTTGTTTTTATTSSITPRENWSGFKRIRTRNVDSGSTTTSRSSDRGFWRHGSASTSSSQSSSNTSSSNGNRSSDFWQRHSPHRPKD